jgi:RNase P subunit RPR2
MKRQTKMRSDFNLRNGELYQRMDFLLKLSNETYSKHNYIAKHYVRMMKDVRKRNALRMDSKFKKLICKCNNLLFKDKETKVELKGTSRITFR